VLNKALPLLLFFAVAVAACSSASSAPVGHENPEHAVVAWFDAVDAGDAITASGAINAESLALILSIENDLNADVLADYLDDGVPLDIQASYWSSFSDGFTEFSSRPISTLTVGESEAFSSEGVEFASVPISGGAGNESVVITRKTSDGTWQVDLVASLGDGFTRLLANEYDALPAGESGERIRLSYELVVVPSLWAAMTVGTFGDDFARTALALIEEVGASE
jgi:hypothetical protein